MIKRFAPFIIAFVFFLFGAYAWKILYSGRKIPVSENREEAQGKGDEFLPLRSVLAVVNEKPITAKDLEWEYQVHIQGVFEPETLTHIPDLGREYHRELLPLKERLASSIIERKMLFEFIKQDDSFDSQNPDRYIDCLKEWQATVNPQTPLLFGPENEERLKMRLCELSLISQYFKERILPNTIITDQEIHDYFNAHRSEFASPQRVIIRQIVLGSEKEARKLKRQVRRHNFAKLAKKHSIAPEAENGGLLGPFAKKDMPRVFDVAFSMRQGKISKILKSTYGFHIIMLVKRFPKAKPNFKAAKSKIEALLKQQKSDKEYQKWVDLALDTIPVTAPKPLW